MLVEKGASVESVLSSRTQGVAYWLLGAREMDDSGNMLIFRSGCIWTTTVIQYVATH